MCVCLCALFVFVFDIRLELKKKKEQRWFSNSSSRRSPIEDEDFHHVSFGPLTNARAWHRLLFEYNLDFHLCLNRSSSFLFLNVMDSPALSQFSPRTSSIWFYLIDRSLAFIRPLFFSWSSSEICFFFAARFSPMEEFFLISIVRSSAHVDSIWTSRCFDVI